MKARLPQEFQSKSQGELMRQAQKMQEDMAALQADLDEREYSANDGNNLVTATVNGKHELISLAVSDQLMEDAKEDKEMLEDLIITAVNSAVKAATESSESEMGKITGGLNIPGLM